MSGSFLILFDLVVFKTSPKWSFWLCWHAHVMVSARHDTMSGGNSTTLLVLSPAMRSEIQASSTEHLRNQCGVRINTVQVSRRTGNLIIQRSSWDSLCTQQAASAAQIQLAGRFQLQVQGTGTSLTKEMEKKKMQNCVFLDKNLFIFLSPRIYNQTPTTWPDKRCAWSKMSDSQDIFSNIIHINAVYSIFLKSNWVFSRLLVISYSCMWKLMSMTF